MELDEVWTQVQGLPEEAKRQVPGALSEKTKRMLSVKRPAEIGAIVNESIEEVNHGSVERLDELIRKRL